MPEMLSDAFDHLGLTIERRIVVTGWKNEFNPNAQRSEVREFTSHHFYGNGTKYWEDRIADPPKEDHQPHITSVRVEERVISDWKTTSIQVAPTGLRPPEKTS